MKKLCFYIVLSVIIFSNPNGNFFAQDSSNILQGGVSLVDKVPEMLFGTWKVYSTQTYTSSMDLYAPYGVDLWTLTKTGNVITLSNPVSGARASIEVEDVTGSTIKFKRLSNSLDEEGLETPTITLSGENFHGTDRIIIKKYKFGQFIREDVVEYNVKGIKMSGDAVESIIR